MDQGDFARARGAVGTLRALLRRRGYRAIVIRGKDETYQARLYSPECFARAAVAHGASAIEALRSAAARLGFGVAPGEGPTVGGGDDAQAREEMGDRVGAMRDLLREQQGLVAQQRATVRAQGRRTTRVLAVANATIRRSSRPRSPAPE